MSDNIQFLQEQINKLQISLASQEVLTNQAIDKMGKNQELLAALHRRLDHIDTELKVLDKKTVTREERKAELEEIVNTKVGSWALKWMGGVFTAISIAVTAWFTDIFKGLF